MLCLDVENCAGAVGVPEQEQPGRQRQPPGRLQGLHLRPGGRRGARSEAGAGHPWEAVGESFFEPYQLSNAAFFLKAQS
jgi:hypothetical protein